MKNGQTNPTEESSQTLYVEVYFEIPYNIFNIVSFIVLMQWVQLWATLSDIVYQQRDSQQRLSNEETMKQSDLSSGKLKHVMVNSTIGVTNSIINPTNR